MSKPKIEFDAKDLEALAWVARNNGTITFRDGGRSVDVILDAVADVHSSSASSSGFCLDSAVGVLRDDLRSDVARRAAKTRKRIAAIKKAEPHLDNKLPVRSAWMDGPRLMAEVQTDGNTSLVRVELARADVPQADGSVFTLHVLEQLADAYNAEAARAPRAR